VHNGHLAVICLIILTSSLRKNIPQKDMSSLSDRISKIRGTILMLAEHEEKPRDILDALDIAWMQVQELEDINSHAPMSELLKKRCKSYNNWQSCTNAKNCIKNGGACQDKNGCAERKRRKAVEAARHILAWLKHVWTKPTPQLPELLMSICEPYTDCCSHLKNGATSHDQNLCAEGKVRIAIEVVDIARAWSRHPAWATPTPQLSNLMMELCSSHDRYCDLSTSLGAATRLSLSPIFVCDIAPVQSCEFGSTVGVSLYVNINIKLIF
jgi:hypothetical protein